MDAIRTKKITEAVEASIVDVSQATSVMQRIMAPEVTAQPPSVAEVIEGFELDRELKTKPTKNQIMTALQYPELCGYTIHYDTFLYEEMVAKVGDTTHKPITDYDYTRIALNLEASEANFNDIGFDRIGRLVETYAKEHKVDSAQVWLKSLVWDGVPRIENLMSDYFGAEKSDYSKAVSLYIATAMAGRVMQPGCKADMVPVLVGAQGCGKSTGVAALSPDPSMFTTVSLANHDDNTIRLMRGKLICELAELRGLSARDQESVKSFLSLGTDEMTEKYAKKTSRYPRRSIFIGTSNRDDFLIDDTGNRRWLPINVSSCDPIAIARDAEQIWAEARDRFLSEGVLWAEAQRMAAEVHGDFMEVDVWEDRVVRWMKNPTSQSYARWGYAEGDPKPDPLNEHGDVTVEQALIYAIGLKASSISKVEKNRMTKIFRKFKFTPRRLPIDGAYVRAWRPPATSSTENE